MIIVTSVTQKNECQEIQNKVGSEYYTHKQKVYFKIINAPNFHNFLFENKNRSRLKYTAWICSWQRASSQEYLICLRSAASDNRDFSLSLINILSMENPVKINIGIKHERRFIKSSRQ